MNDSPGRAFFCRSRIVRDNELNFIVAEVARLKI